MATKSKRMDGEDRLKIILDAGAKLAAKHGAVNVTRKMVAEAAKVSPALVAHYTGSAAEGQKLYAKHAKKLGLEQPPKDKIEAIGVKMRAHGPRSKPVQRKRSAKEVQAIKRNVAKGKAKPSVNTRGTVTTVKTRKSGGDARDVPVPALGGKTLRQAKPSPGKQVASRLGPVKPKTPAKVVKTLAAPVKPVNVPAKKKPAATAARAPIAPPVAPPPVAPGSDSVN